MATECGVRWSDRGAVTAETAVVLPALTALLLLALWSVNVVVLQLRCDDAARTAARALARGEPVGLVRAETARVAPPGARLQIAQGSEQVTVEVVARARLPGPWRGRNPGIELRSRAVAAAESQAVTGVGGWTERGG